MAAASPPLPSTIGIQNASQFPRPSTDIPNLSDEEEDEEDYREDWNRVTAEKDSFSNQERRRNIGGLKWKNIERYPATNAKLNNERAGSILSVFEIGHENGVKIPDDPAEREEYERKRLASVVVPQLEGVEDYPQIQRDSEEGQRERHGSVLSAFTRANQHFDDAIVIPDERPTERRPSVAPPTIEKIDNYPTLSKEAGRDEKYGSILSVFQDDHDDVHILDASVPKEDRPPGEKAGRKGITIVSPTIMEAPKIPIPKKDRRGSVLSMWTDKSDDWSSDEEAIDSDIKSVSSAGNSKLDVPAASKGNRRTSSGSGREHRGSILSLWSSGKDKDGNHTIHHNEDDD